MFRQFCLSVAMPIALVVAGGCNAPRKPLPPIPVTLTVIESRESEGNKVARFSGGIYQQFFDVTLEVTDPPEHAGGRINLKAETRIGNLGQITAPGTRVQCNLDPSFIGSTDQCTMEDLIGWGIVEDED